MIGNKTLRMKPTPDSNGFSNSQNYCYHESVHFNFVWDTFWDLKKNVDRMDGFLPQLPSVPLIRPDDVCFYGVEDCLCAALTLADGS